MSEDDKDSLGREAGAIQDLLLDKVLARVMRPRIHEVVLEFSDGTRFLVDTQSGCALEFSVTGGESED
ncbi:hypothetical protein FDP08_14100 [Marinobacter panjinensis]|uniref:DUF2292 domain-containing protein n=1 Tax=Marinobacter panjinensis TaxID=2576384 RepID=A0A4U6R5M4_9GAMM|nr:hypothetical protein [Marinobacter panjinensis]TKV69144.1 hypothetical protein FDP08_14100 [Marinobacter panjinensis]